MAVTIPRFIYADSEKEENRFYALQIYDYHFQRLPWTVRYNSNKEGLREEMRTIKVRDYNRYMGYWYRY